ncbi:MAG: hypothetical protein ACRDZ4_08490 [Egibacteraceae bacterium]
MPGLLQTAEYARRLFGFGEPPLAPTTSPRRSTGG